MYLLSKIDFWIKNLKIGSVLEDLVWRDFWRLAYLWSKIDFWIKNLKIGSVLEDLVLRNFWRLAVSNLVIFWINTRKIVSVVENRFLNKKFKNWIRSRRSRFTWFLKTCCFKFHIKWIFQWFTYRNFEASIFGQS